MARKTMKELKYVFVGHSISEYICELYKFIVLCVNVLYYPVHSNRNCRTLTGVYQSTRRPA